jgi:hypothetical protein
MKNLAILLVLGLSLTFTNQIFAQPIPQEVDNTTQTTDDSNVVKGQKDKPTKCKKGQKAKKVKATKCKKEQKAKTLNKEHNYHNNTTDHGHGKVKTSNTGNINDKAMKKNKGKLRKNSKN